MLLKGILEFIVDVQQGRSTAPHAAGETDIWS